MKTCQLYINEYKLYDDLYEIIESTYKEVNLAVYDHERSDRNLELKSFFEKKKNDNNIEPANQSDKVKSKEGFLAKIGNAMIRLLNGIKKMIQNFTEKIFPQSEKIKDDVEVVKEIIEKHPELGKQICEGIDKEWFTYRDVSKFEKDLVGLMRMLEKQAIDHKTFMQKFTDSCRKFQDSGKIIVAAGFTLANLLLIVPRVLGAVKTMKKDNESFKDIVTDFNNKLEKNYTQNGAPYVQSVVNALGQALGLISHEAQVRQKGQSFLSKLLQNLKNKGGKNSQGQGTGGSNQTP